VPRERAFAKAEYGTRIARTRLAMDAAGINVLLVHSLPNICYLTGYQTPLADWYHCLILPRVGEPILQVCDPELAAMNTYVNALLPVSWEEMDAAADQLVGLLSGLGAATLAIGIERRRPGLNPHTERRLVEALPRSDVDRRQRPRPADSSNQVAGGDRALCASRRGCRRWASKRRSRRFDQEPPKTRSPQRRCTRLSPRRRILLHRSDRARRAPFRRHPRDVQARGRPARLTRC
jgi:hypothetical protein